MHEPIFKTLNQHLLGGNALGIFYLCKRNIQSKQIGSLTVHMTSEAFYYTNLKINSSNLCYHSAQEPPSLGEIHHNATTSQQAKILDMAPNKKGTWRLDREDIRMGKVRKSQNYKHTQRTLQSDLYRNFLNEYLICASIIVIISRGRLASSDGRVFA